MNKRSCRKPPYENDLASALAAFHGHLDDWQGIISREVLAVALRGVLRSYLQLVASQTPERDQNILVQLKGKLSKQSKQVLSPRQNLDNVHLLEAVIAGLSDENGEGPRLELLGTQGAPANSSVFEQRFRIADFVITAMSSGTKYECAKENAAREFGCGKTKVAQAYSQLRSTVMEFRRLEHLSSDVAGEFYSRAKMNPKSGKVR